MHRSVLITGGFGYVGGRVAQALSANGNSVVLGSRARREAPAWLPEATCATTDWDSTEQLTSICDGVDSVVHAAAMNEIDAATDPVGALKMNGVASVRMVEAAIAAGVRRFVYFSTAHVYASPLVGTFDETTFARPIHPYATSHRAAEDVVLAAHAKGRIEGIVIRLSNSFGAPAHPHVDRWSLLVNDLCRQAVTDGHLTLRSAGLQTRDFVTLEDVGRAVNHLLSVPSDPLHDGIINVGGEWAPSIYEVAQRVATQYNQCFGKSLEIRRPTPSKDEQAVAATNSLVYKIDRLKGTGFQLENNVAGEIDATLRLCQSAFADDN